jgi:UDP-glucose 4-epimerase
MNNVLVTGGAGYIGSHIIELLIKKKYKVFIIDNLSTGYRKLISKRAKFYKLNINNFKKVKNIIKEKKIDSIIHLAASTTVSNSKKNNKLFYDNNVKGTSNLIKACKDTLVKNFIFSSTAAIYQDSRKKVKESSRIKPQSIYGLTKLKAEKIIIKELKKLKINFAILRFFNVVGASPSKKIGPLKKNDNLFKNISMALFKSNRKIMIYGNNLDTKDGTCIRDYIHVSDISEIHLKILNKISKLKKSVVLNCGYGKGVSVKEVVNGFIKFTKKEVNIIILKKRPADIVSSIANINKLKNFIKWKPKYSNLNVMIRDCLIWEKNLNTN